MPTSRCEWGTAGIHALEPADVVIVVDVLSFTTCVDIAVGRGAVILPYPWKDASAAAFAEAHGAVLAAARGTGSYSLSPASFLDAPAGGRCVLPSPNGAAVALCAATTGSIVFAGCLRNASAVASRARAVGRTFNVIPAGERWPDGTLRFATEDWIAAGAILRALPGSKSPEASAAIAAFERHQSALDETLAACPSGQELIGRGFAVDVELAARLDESAHVPSLEAGEFVRWEAGRGKREEER